jgi:hypothetical protein
MVVCNSSLTTVLQSFLFAEIDPITATQASRKMLSQTKAGPVKSVISVLRSADIIYNCAAGQNWWKVVMTWEVTTSAQCS